MLKNTKRTGLYCFLHKIRYKQISVCYVNMISQKSKLFWNNGLRVLLGGLEYFKKKFNV